MVVQQAIESAGLLTAMFSSQVKKKLAQRTRMYDYRHLLKLALMLLKAPLL